MDEITLKLNSPITDEQWDAITDVDFDHTDRIWFSTKNGKEVEFTKIVRCRDCKHKPTGTDRDSYEFPDDRCPCKCEDYWYSWNPDDDWFCANGERKNDE